MLEENEVPIKRVIIKEDIANAHDITDITSEQHLAMRRFGVQLLEKVLTCNANEMRVPYSKQVIMLKQLSMYQLTPSLWK